MSFSSFALHSTLEKELIRQSFTSPTPIQAQAIPHILEGKDLLGLAQTGTGKTAAFVLPVLQKLLAGPQDKKGIKALILAPTRELANQINDVIIAFVKGTKLRTFPIYGGVRYQRQFDALRRGVDILVACPGRLLDHLQQGSVSLNNVETLVLDEADQMFDMGFLPNIRKVLKKLPTERQTVMFSATMPDDIRRLAREILRDPVTVEVRTNEPLATIEHSICHIPTDKKGALLLHVMGTLKDEESTLVFVRTKHRAKRFGEILSNAGYRATTLQGGLSQARRDSAMKGFRDGKYRVMVATDIASRGIDVSQITHVVNVDMPDTVEAYTHRIGRTGRASRNGSAMTFVAREDNNMLRAIERKLAKKIEAKLFNDFDPKTIERDPPMREEIRFQPRYGESRDSGPRFRDNRSNDRTNDQGGGRERYNNGGGRGHFSNRSNSEPRSADRRSADHSSPDNGRPARSGPNRNYRGQQDRPQFSRSRSY
jgi:ATP-dependent RNA helicase RhlE